MLSAFPNNNRQLSAACSDNGGDFVWETPKSLTPVKAERKMRENFVSASEKSSTYFHLAPQRSLVYIWRTRLASEEGDEKKLKSIV